jgi:hypothetical protein
VTVEAVVYTPEGTRTCDDLRTAREASGTTWVRSSNATAEETERVAETFGIHSLAVEDVRTTSAGNCSRSRNCCGRRGRPSTTSLAATPTRFILSAVIL